MIRKIPDDSDRNYDIVHMLKKIAIGLESKNVDDLRAIAHELEAWEPHGDWSKLDVKTKVFVEHILTALARLQLGFEILDKGADELTNIRQKVENDEIHDVMYEADHEDDFKRKMDELVSEYDELTKKCDELQKENFELAQKITTANLDEFCTRNLDSVDDDEKFTCERCGILKRKSAPAVSNYRDVDGHKICARCYRGFKHWMERVKDCKTPDFLQRPSRKNKKSKNLKEYWDKREAYRDEIFRKLEEMKRNQKREYVDEAEWWLDKRYGTDKQHCDKKDLTDDEKEDLK